MLAIVCRTRFDQAADLVDDVFGSAIPANSLTGARSWSCISSAKETTGGDSPTLGLSGVVSTWAALAALLQEGDDLGADDTGAA
jgi:hypothetical protein